MGMNASLLHRFVELAGERLDGDWVILGGAVVPLLGGRYRVTLDIDVAGPDDAGAAATNELLRIALDLGLPVEAVNQSAAFFLRAVPDWRDRLHVLHVGSLARVLVPDVALFVQLKLGRLSQSDLEDCVARIALARSAGDDFDDERLLALISAQRDGCTDPGRLTRLDALQTAVDRPGA